MSNDVTDQLRAGIERVPAQVPRGLASAAYRRYRRRRAGARAIAAAATAAAAGVAATVFLARPAAPATPTTGYVVSHLTQALDAMPASTVVFDRTTYTPPGTGPGSYPTDSWTSDGRMRQEIFTQAGRLVVDHGYVLTDDRHDRTQTTLTTVAVEYQTKTWWRSVGAGPRRRRSRPVTPTCDTTRPNTIAFNPSAMAAAIRLEVSCGTLKADGTATIDGVTAIKLDATMPHMTMTYWVNPATYLPVRITVTRGPGIPAMQDDFQWLPPTAANLAKVNLPVPPPGFRQVPANGCLTGCSP